MHHESSSTTTTTAADPLPPSRLVFEPVTMRVHPYWISYDDHRTLVYETESSYLGSEQTSSSCSAIIRLSFALELLCAWIYSKCVWFQSLSTRWNYKSSTALQFLTLIVELFGLRFLTLCCLVLTGTNDTTWWFLWCWAIPERPSCKLIRKSAYICEYLYQS